MPAIKWSYHELLRKAQREGISMAELGRRGGQKRARLARKGKYAPYLPGFGARKAPSVPTTPLVYAKSQKLRPSPRERVELCYLFWIWRTANPYSDMPLLPAIRARYNLNGSDLFMLDSLGLDCQHPLHAAISAWCEAYCLCRHKLPERGPAVLAAFRDLLADICRDCEDCNN